MVHVTTKIITEESIRRSLAVLIVAVFVSLVMLAVAARSLLGSLDTVQVASADSMTKTRAEAVMMELARHTDSDMRILRLLATFFDTAQQLNGELKVGDAVGTMLSSMDKFGFESDFLSIIWYNLNGEGFRADIGNGTMQRTLLSEDTVVMQDTINTAREKREAISDVHFDPVLQRRVVIYAQAAYDQNGAQGIIAGVHGLDETQAILDDVSEREAHFSYFLVDANATFVASAAASGYPEIIYYTQGVERVALPIFPPESRSQIQRVRQGFVTIRQDERAYHGYIEPLSFADIELRLICLNTDLNAATITNQQIYSTKLVFAVFCMAVALSVFLGTVLTYSYGNRLIRFLYFDMLTGADNSNRFRRKLTNRLEKSSGNGDHLSIATLNVRQFRSINEIFGVDSANSLLITIKQTLSENLDKDEFFCRASNDLFHVCLHDCDRQEIRERLEAIMDEVVQKFLETHDYRLKMYAGVVILDSEGIAEISVSEVFLRLSLSLAKAKEDVTETVFFYEESLYVKEETENYIETHMETALAAGEFKMYLQPKMDLSSGTVGAAEALVRWSASDDGRMIFPDQFIPLFNRNGFCVKLDMYMLEQACKQMREWIDSSIEPVPISVNQSRLLFFEADYVDNVTAIAAKYSIPPGLITLEVLEEMYLEKTDEVNTKIAELRKRGFLISMDDFGSGYSSFSAIGELSVDELKLDRKFLMSASGSESWRMKIVIDQVVRMARRLHLSVVAEGVETKEDEQLIKSLGCDYGQGYYYCKPIPAAEFNERYMHNQQAHDDDDEELPFSPELS